MVFWDTFSKCLQGPRYCSWYQNSLDAYLVLFRSGSGGTRQSSPRFVASFQALPSVWGTDLLGSLTSVRPRTTCGNCSLRSDPLYEPCLWLLFSWQSAQERPDHSLPRSVARRSSSVSLRCLHLCVGSRPSSAGVAPICRHPWFFDDYQTRWFAYRTACLSRAASFYVRCGRSQQAV